MTAFDPFTATLAQALAHPDAHAIRGAVWQWSGAQELTGRREFYERNPLGGMAVCATHDLVAPDWLARAYLRGFDAVAGCRVRSWDEAFGTPHPKGANLAAQRRSRINRVEAVNAFDDLLQRDPGRPVDKALWEEIGRSIGEGATRAEELYREGLRMGIGSTAADIRKRLGWPLRPAKFRKLAGVLRKR